MRITLNGAPTEVAARTLAELPGAGRSGVAVAHNGVVVPRAELVARALAEGDTVEVVTAVQGG